MYGLKFATPLIALFVVGCAGFHLDEAKKTWPQGTPFERLLFVEYRDRAQNEFSEGDYKSSDFFALRAIAASAPRTSRRKRWANAPCRQARKTSCRTLVTGW